MHTQNYVEIANIINAEIAVNRDQCSMDIDDLFRNFTGSLADYFKRENPNFDRKLFYQACGVYRD